MSFVPAFPNKRPKDKNRDELLLELQSLRALTERQSAIIAGYEETGKHKSESTLSDNFLEAQKGLIRSLEEQLLKKQEELEVQNEALAKHLVEINARNQSLLESKEVLQLNEAKLINAQRIVHLGFWIWDVEKDHLEWSDEVYHILGLRPQEFLPTYKLFFNFVHPDDHDVISYSIADVREKNIPCMIDWRVLRRDGTIRFVHSEIEMIKDDKGGSGKIFATIQDITERKLMENALRESEDKFRVLAEASSAGILVHQNEQTLYVNRAMAEIEGYTIEERLRLKFWETTHPDFQELAKRRGMDRLKGLRVPPRNEIKILRKDGEERWVDSSAGLLLFNGKPAVMLVSQDITKRKRAEKALKKSQYILSKAQQIAHVGNWAWNLQTGIMNWSEEGFRIFGYLPQEVQPSFTWLLSRIHPEDKDLANGFFSDIIHKRIRCNIDFRIIKPDGSIRYVNSVADKVVNDSSGNPEWAYGINQDITDRKIAEEALKAAKSDTELYVDLMGHDINNMNQITMGFLELAEDIMKFEGKLDIDNIHLLDKSIQSLQNSSILIDNVRKIQREKLGLYNSEVIDVGCLLADVTAQFQDVPGRQITIDYEPMDGCLVNANALLKDVFINLIGNSIKHSYGPLTINIQIDKESKRGYYKVIVQDNGPGIPDNLKKTLFDRLNLDNTRARGKGFGLCLIKMLVDDYHGKFWAEDRVPGDSTQGIRFVVMLPDARIA